MKYAFAGDRAIAVEILSFLKSKGNHPLALLVNDTKGGSHAEELKNISGLPSQMIFSNKSFLDSQAIETLKHLELDYIIGIHFPYIIPKHILSIPRIGFLNLHPAYLPFNKGWHTPSWAILEGDPYGATLHFMTPQLDEGAIIHQKLIEIGASDTANSLYARVLQLELDVFVEAYPSLVSLTPKKMKQKEKGTSHSKKDLASIQEIDLDKEVTYREAINTFRALTTNRWNEASFFMENGKKYAIQIDIKEIDS